MADCRGCGAPIGKGHGKVCFLWFLAKLLLILGLIAASGAAYLNYTGELWLWFSSTDLYLKAALLLLLSIISRMCYRDCKKALMMQSMMDGGCGEGGSCGSEGGGCCGEETGGHQH